MLRRIVAVALPTLLVVLASCLTQAQTSNGPVNYIYDDLGRLVAVVDGQGNAAVYAYDAVGNILSISRITAGQVSIIYFTPSSGPVGTTVTISGTGFSTTASQNAVQFNGVSAVVTSSTATEIVTTVPASATSGPISVTSPNGSATSSSSFTVTAGSDGPTITGFSPAIATAGTAITLTGTNFDLTPNNDRLILNTTYQGVSSVASSTSLTVAVPASTGSGRFTLSTMSGTAVSDQDVFVPYLSHTPSDIEFTGRMAIGDTTTVTINTAHKVGMVVFDAVAGEKLNIDTSGLSNTAVYLFDPHGAELSSGLMSLQSPILSANGTYAIGIDPQGGTGSLSLALTDISDVRATIQMDGPAVTVTTTLSGQDAKVTFTASAGQRAFLQVSNVSNPYAYVYLVRPDGSTQAGIGVYNSSQVFLMDTQTLGMTGTYTLWIQHSGTGVGSETLLLNSVPPDFTASITVGGSAVRVPTTGDTSLGQNAVLSFTGTTGQLVSFNVTNGTYTSGYCTLYIKDPNGTVVSGGGCGAYAYPFIDTITLQSTGTYTIFVDPYGTR